MTISTELDRRIDDVVHLRDELGVVSIYVGIDPVAEARARPAWEIELDVQLRTLRSRLREEADRTRWVAFKHRLEGLAPVLSRLVDATEHGRGRALFAALTSSEVVTVATQAPLPTVATLGSVAHVLPLLEVDDGHPVGLVLLGRDRLRTLEARVGEVIELAAFDVEPAVTEGPERKGPAAASPFRARQTVPHRERYERHLETEHSRLVARAAERIVESALERGWELAAVAGDPRGTGIVKVALVAAGVDVERVDRTLEGLAPPAALAELAPVLDVATQRRHGALVRRARDAAATGGHGALGLADVLTALAEGRVERLLLDGGRSITGALGPSDELVPPGIRPAGLTEDELRPEPMLADRMAVHALETGARVTVVDADAAAALADADGVAALLRW